MAASTARTPLVVIVGETASGKSALAMEIAEHFNGEIICADAVTVYEGFDIGSAKPSTHDRKLINHYLLDVADPLEGYNVAKFKVAASRAIKEVNSHNKLPIMVGGTGLYIDSVLFDYKFLPTGGRKVRAELNQMSLEQLANRAVRLGYDFKNVDVSNKRRLIRLIETKGQQSARGQLRDNTLILGISLSPELIKHRIELRVDDMLAAGLEREVARLSSLYGWEIEPMKAVAYREWRSYFDKSATLEETRQQIISSNLKLAKKQRTWFKRNKSIHWLNDSTQQIDIDDILTTFLNKR